MGKLDTNVETYRILAETLVQLRATTRALLRNRFGETWEVEGIPELVRGFLDQRRMRESSIQWRLLETVDLLDFAGFENIAEIVAADALLVEAFTPVSPDADLLRARFIELDSVQARVAFARPVTEGEMEFVVSFSERLRRVSPAAGPAAPAPVPEASRPTARPRVDAPPTPAAAARGTAAPAPVRPVAQEPAAPTGAAEQRAVRPASAGAAVDAPPTLARPISASELAQALDAGNVTRALTALYSEVTRLAELLWGEGIAGQAPQWEMVRESRWYHENFSRLGLKALSDFYDVLRDVGERTSRGASRTEAQEMLQERRFGEILLALRELFRRYLVDQTGPAPHAVS